jgi:hypothetical protein
MDRRLCLLVPLVVTACAFSGVATLPTSAGATLVKAVPVAIESKVDGHRTRSFTLTYHPQASASVADRGSARRNVANQTAGRLGDGTSRRRLLGTELLEGARGTLMLRWHGVQRKTDGRWGTATGTWSIGSGTGIYAGCTGRGQFISNEAATEYLGWLITAV